MGTISLQAITLLIRIVVSKRMCVYTSKAILEYNKVAVPRTAYAEPTLDYKCNIYYSDGF